MMSVFSKKSRRGKRNTIILFASLVVVVIVIFVVLIRGVGDCSEEDPLNLYIDSERYPSATIIPSAFPDSSAPSNIAISPTTTLDIPTHIDLPSVSPENLSMDEFWNCFVSQFGVPYENDVRFFAESLLYNDGNTPDYHETTLDALVTGDLAVFGDNVGVCVGSIEGHPVFVHAPGYGNIVSNIPELNLSYSSLDFDSLCVMWHPYPFNTYLHCNDNPFSELFDLNDRISDIEQDSEGVALSIRLREILLHYSNMDLTDLVACLNDSYLDSKQLTLQKSAFYKHIDKFNFANAHADSDELLYFAENVFRTDTYNIVTLNIYNLVGNHLELAQNCKFTLYNDNTYIPYSVIGGSTPEAYGFITLKEGEQLIESVDVPEELEVPDSNIGQVVQREDGVWVYRLNGGEIVIPGQTEKH